MRGNPTLRKIGCKIGDMKSYCIIMYDMTAYRGLPLPLNGKRDTYTHNGHA